ncbi:MAG: glycosyltransferase family 9 protein [Pseudomonadota bacterium]|nr:glycosyltransferase family 9 protein [Pseudomonadota bacterium]
MDSNQDLLASGSSARRRLLVVQPLVGIGDMVWHKPWIDHLAAHFDIVLACKPTAKAEVLFHGTAGIVEYLPIERSLRGRHGRHDGPLGLLRLAAAFRATGADSVLVMHHSATYGTAARLAGIANRWGYGIGRSRRWLNRGVFLGAEARYQHPTRKLAEFAKANGFGLDRPEWVMPPSEAARRAAAAWCDSVDIPDFGTPADELRDMVVMGVTAMDEERMWPPAHFAALAARIREFSPATGILVMGAPSEQPVIDAVLADPAAPAGLIPNTAPLDEAVALINASRLYVGNDTSLLNIAAACGRPAAGIFAQSSPLDYSDAIVPIPEPDGRFGEPGAINRITAAQAFDVVAGVLTSQLPDRT